MNETESTLVFFDAGGGHRAAANALRQVIETQQRPWDVHLVNLQELLDPLDIFRRITGLRLQDIYNLDAAQRMDAWLAAVGAADARRHHWPYHRPTVRLLEKFLARGTAGPGEGVLGAEFQPGDPERAFGLRAAGAFHT